MPRRLNYTGRKKINRSDAVVRLHSRGDGLTFDADLRFADYGLDQITPPPRVYVEAYRGASTLWKRFDFGRIGTITPPPDRSLKEFGVPEGILFRVKVSADGEALGKLLAEADVIRPRLAEEQDAHGQPLIQHMPADDIGGELWRITDFDGSMPLLKINSRVPMGVEQFLIDPQHRAIFAPAVMRQVLTRILIIDCDMGDEEDDTDYRPRWLTFAASLGVGECPGVVDDDNTLQAVESWIDEAVEAFTARADLFTRFAQQPTQQEGQR